MIDPNDVKIGALLQKSLEEGVRIGRVAPSNFQSPGASHGGISVPGIGGGAMGVTLRQMAQMGWLTEEAKRALNL